MKEPLQLDRGGDYSPASPVAQGAGKAADQMHVIQKLSRGRILWGLLKR